MVAREKEILAKEGWRLYHVQGGGSWHGERGREEAVGETTDTAIRGGKFISKKKK